MDCSESIDYDAEISVLLLGNCSVGKTSLIRAFMGEPFLFTNEATVGVDMKSRILRLYNQEKIVNFVMWDAAGQNTFKTVVHSYIRQADCYIMVFDVTYPESFQDIEEWLRVVEDKGNEENICFLMGNKIDVKSNGSKTITLSEAVSYCVNSPLLHDTPFMVSAKTGQAVDDAFYKVAEILFDKISSGNRTRQDTVEIRTLSRTHSYDVRDSTMIYSTPREPNNCSKNSCSSL